MQAGFNIRESRAEDAEAIFAVTRDSAAGLAVSHYSAEQVAGWMGDRTPETYREAAASGRMRVAEHQGKLVGFVDAVPGEIYRLFLLPEVAGQGLGKRLMEIGIALAKTNHDGPLKVEATLNAKAFYERFGFRQTGTGFFAGRNGEWPPIEVVYLEREE